MRRWVGSHLLLRGDTVTRARSVVVLVAILLAACGDDGGASPGVDADISSLAYTACDPSTRVGGFEVVLTDEYTGVQGQVYDSTLPASIPTTLATIGACRLLAAPNHQCTPSCGASEVCNAALTCIPYPIAHSVGVVEVAGLLADVQMSPRSPTFFYSNSTPLPHPGYSAGSVIGLFADGGDYESFHVLGYGIDKLVLSASTYALSRDTDLALAWTPPSTSGPAKMIISLNINGHGLVGAHVECTVDDNGSYTLPGSLITQLIDAGTSGFPTITLTRMSLDATSISPGCVDLRVHSSVKLDVTVPGVQSCNDDDDCTAPETCRGDLTCG
jgi:hypothetical protein